jgi:serine/threonine protein kinase
MTETSQSQSVGGYELKSEIGRGGNTVVYRAFDPTQKQDVALKLFPRGLLLDPTYADYFVEQVGRFAAFKHPRAVPILDYGHEQEQLFIVTRLMPGGSLRGRLQQGPLAPSEAMGLLRHIADGLQAAHAQGIVHGGVQPNNMLFDDGGQIHIGDFGIFSLFQYASGSTTSFTIGSPAYYSPEQALGITLKPQSDVYSLAAVLFEMLAGRSAVDSTGPPVLVAQRHVTDPTPSIRQARPDLPPGYEAVMGRALNKVPEERYESIEAFLQALADTDRPAAPPPAAGAESAARTITPGPFRAWLLVGIAVLIVIVVMIALAFATSVRP